MYIYLSFIYIYIYLDLFKSTSSIKLRLQHKINLVQLFNSTLSNKFNLNKITMTDVIISDFDETITKKDSILVFGQLPYYKDPEKFPKWTHYTDNYMQGWNKYNNQAPLRRLPLLDSVSTETISHDNYTTLFGKEIQYQDYLRKIELHSTNELSRLNHFTGIKYLIPEYINYCFNNKSIEIRDGFQPFLNCIYSHNDIFYVLSINWSREFIIEVINNERLTKTNVFCNALELKDSEYNGCFSNKLLTGSDKILYLNHIIKEQSKQIDGCKFWYIGDSETDLLSILHPSTNGILLLDPSENMTKFKNIVNNILGVDQNSINKFLRDNVSIIQLPIEKCNKNGVYLAKTWDSIKNLLYNGNITYHKKN